MIYCSSSFNMLVECSTALSRARLIDFLHNTLTHSMTQSPAIKMQCVQCPVLPFAFNRMSLIAIVVFSDLKLIAVVVQTYYLGQPHLKESLKY